MNSQCPTCHNDVNKEDIFCSHCGNQIKTAKKVSLAEKTTLYVLAFLLAPFGLYWFFKYIKSTDEQEKKLAIGVLVVTIIAVLLMLISGILAANYYGKLLEDYIYI